MARQQVDIGVEGNDGTGDSIRESFRKVNENFQELYAVFGVGGQITFTTLSDTPDELTPTTIPLVNDSGTEINLVELASDNTEDSNATDSITFKYDTDGKLIVKVNSVNISLDGSPAISAPFNASGYAIGGVGITTQKAEDINLLHDTDYTIDDLVITKGYADRRYVTSGLPVRVAAEPAGVSQYTLTINRYIDGNIEVLSHGYESGANGTAFIFTAEDTDPTGLTTGTTYYIRYVSDDQLSLHATQEQAVNDDDNTRVKVVASGSIAADDVHTIVDAAYDSDLTGNFLSDVAMPRESVTRRQGDTMTGALYLHDHPGELAGQGSPNGLDDLQAATKFYVDNTAYSSPENLFVSTGGDNTMAGVPAGKEGTSYTYAYRTINAAAQRANELVETAPEEPGPYFQTITRDNGTADADVTVADYDSPVFEQTRYLIEQNKDFVIKEVTGFLNQTYTDFAFDQDRWESDLESIISAIAFDINKGLNANILTRKAALKFYSTVEGRNILGPSITQRVASIEEASDIIDAVLQNQLHQQKTISDITRAAPAVVTTSTNHGWTDGSLVEFKTIGGMTQIEGEVLYMKKLTDTTFELFSDSSLTVPYDTSAYDGYTTGGVAGRRYQTIEEQFFDIGDDADTSARNSITGPTGKFVLVTNILQNGIDAAPDIVYGGTYKLVLNNGSQTYVDQGNPANTDTLSGKVIRGKRSGALGRIVTLTNNDGSESNNDTYQLNLLTPVDFEVGESVEYGNYIKKKQVTIFVESGIYEEDYPIRIPANCSIKGDEFRRVIVRPKDRVSQSPWANTYFYRDKEFDGLTLLTTGTPFTNSVGEEQGFFGHHYLTDNTNDINVGPAVTNAGGFTSAAAILERNRDFLVEETIEYISTNYPALVYNETKCRRDTGLIVDAIISDLETGGDEASLEAQGEYYTGALADSSQEIATEDAIDNISTLAGQLLVGTAPTQNGSVEPDISLGTGESGSVSVVGNLVDKINFAFDPNYNPPLRNDQMDVFLLNDATIVRNITCQGHGGFMDVLDPAGQILTKSPYTQTASSFSKSINAKTFAGGMFVDAFVGNIPVTIDSKDDAFTLDISSAAGQGLFIREPQLPCPFYIEGRRYQVNAISDYDSGLGTATIYLDADSNGGTGYDETQFTENPGVVSRDIFLQTAGNRSMLANDYTQINDLGYGLICINGAFSEQVSTFTYYCHVAYYAKNGSEIRSLNGSNGYGNFGLVAEGADPNEVPDQVTYRDPMVQPAKAFTDTTFTNATEDASIYVTDLRFKPLPNSRITIDHGGAIGRLDYDISAVTNMSDQDNDETVGESGDVVVTGVSALDAGTISITTAPGMQGTFENLGVNGGSGGGVTVNVTVDHAGSPNTATVTLVNVGQGYAAGETLTVQGDALGGASPANDLTIDIDTIYGSAAGEYSNAIYKLDLRGDDAQPDNFFGQLQDTVADGTLIEYRNNFTHILDSVNSPGDLITRPSTAVNFDESDNTTYRSISFQTSDAFSIALASDEVNTTFEVGFDFVELAVSSGNLLGGNGSAQGDTRIAVQNVDADNGARLVRDVAGREPGDAGYSGGMLFVWDGKVHQITNFDNDSTVDYIEFQDYDSFTINTGYGGTGLASGISTSGDITLSCGLPPASTAEITIAISLCRATGHDFTQIGTGSFNDSNYPNVLLGEPENNLADFYTDSNTAVSSQVWERRKGRVFFVSTDQNGFFRVGKFFSVDQATGDIQFAGEIGLTNANSLGFKRGVTINEFSADDSFADDSGQAVPTERAVGSYLSRRLGYNIAGSQILGSGNRIGPGFLTLDGDTPMEGQLDMGSNKITNVTLPGSDGSAATNKNYVDEKVSAFDELGDLRNIELNNSAENDLLVFTGKKKIVTDPASGGTFSIGNTLTGDFTGATGTIVDIDLTSDTILGSITKITYTPVSGTFTTDDNVSNGTASADVLDGPFDEVANASEATASDINVTVTRSASGAEYNLQIESGAILNADVNASAAIAQSKLNMQAADTAAAAPGSPDQSVLGLARFDSANFDATNGWIKIKDNGVALAEIAQIAADTVIGNSTAGTATPTAVSFSDVVDQGSGLQHADFGSYTGSSDQVLTRTASETYTTTNISTGSTANTIAKRDANGSIQGDSFIIGGDASYEILSESSATLTFKTPGQGVILTSSGSSNPTVNIPGSVDIGSVGVTESTFQEGSALAGESRLAVDWIYSSFIEAPGEKDNTSTGIGIGDNVGFAEDGADKIILVTGGSTRLHVGDATTTITNDIDVEGGCNVDGATTLNSTLDVDGATTLNGNVDLGNATADRITFNGYVDSNIEPDATASNRNLGNSARKWNTVYAQVFNGVATTAQYADLAENYLADAMYDPGTVVVFGGDAEVTVTDVKGNRRVAGIVSTDPAYLMNSELQGEFVASIALQGRVPCKALGRVAKGDILVSSAIPGYAIVDNDPRVGTVIGKAVGEKLDSGKGVVEVVVGRV